MRSICGIGCEICPGWRGDNRRRRVGIGVIGVLGWRDGYHKFKGQRLVFDMDVNEVMILYRQRAVSRQIFPYNAETPVSDSSPVPCSDPISLSLCRKSW